MDELGQYFHLYRPSRWEAFCLAAGFDGNAVRDINALFDEHQHPDSRHYAATHALSLFNRLSEECLRPDQLRPRIEDPTLAALVRMYAAYVDSLHPTGQPASTDFALLQQEALDVLSRHDGAT